MVKSDDFSSKFLVGRNIDAVFVRDRSIRKGLIAFVLSLEGLLD